MNINCRALFSFFALAACLVLSSCASSGSSSHVDINNPSYGQVDKALIKAAQKAEKSGNTVESISYLEKLYTRHSDDQDTALNFARALRQNSFNLRADTVLRPFANKTDANVEVQNEYAAIKLAQGQFKQAQKYAWRAVQQDEENARAHDYLGIALDGQENHEAAETSFRKALDLWEGDPTGVMNNLALCLTAQNKLDEAEDILEQAKSIAPYKIEIERNLRIVRALKESSSYTYTSKKNDEDEDKPSEDDLTNTVPLPGFKPNS